MLACLSLDIVCSSWLTVFLELRSRKTVRFSGQMVSVDRYPGIFSSQMATIVYIPLFLSYFCYIFIIFDRSFFLFIVFIDSCLTFLATMVIIGS